MLLSDFIIIFINISFLLSCIPIWWRHQSYSSNVVAQYLQHVIINAWRQVYCYLASLAIWCYLSHQRYHHRCCYLPVLVIVLAAVSLPVNRREGSLVQVPCPGTRTLFLSTPTFPYYIPPLVYCLVVRFVGVEGGWDCLQLCPSGRKHLPFSSHYIRDGI